MKIMHLMAYEKFTEPYIKFINDNFDSNDHLFFLYGENENYVVTKYQNVIKLNMKNFFSFTKSLYKSKKIIIHGLFFNKKLSFIFISQPWLLNKSYWVIWGGDLYHYLFKEKGFKTNINEFVRGIIIRKVSGLITHIKGDYELAKMWYGAEGNYYYSFMYPSNLFHEHPTVNTINNDTVYILIGNSADSSNEHVEIFHLLEKFKNKDIKIICPLSYGQSEYREYILDEGNNIFGDKFIPLTEFLSFNDYMDILSKVEIAIFNHKRQQALGNILNLLGLGKKVYIRNDITTWKFCIEHHLKVSDTCGTFDDIFEKMNEKDRELNIENIKEQFSEKKLKSDWNEIFTAPLLDD
jgi:hypothetical protein